MIRWRHPSWSWPPGLFFFLSQRVRLSECFGKKISDNRCYGRIESEKARTTLFSFWQSEWGHTKRVHVSHSAMPIVKQNNHLLQVRQGSLNQDNFQLKKKTGGNEIIQLVFSLAKKVVCTGNASFGTHALQCTEEINKLIHDKIVLHDSRGSWSSRAISIQIRKPFDVTIN